MKTLGRYFLEGLIYLAPVVVTIYLVYLVFTKIDRLFQFSTPGIGFAVTILLITAVGFVVSNFVTRRLARLTDAIFTRLPLVKMIYKAVKDLMGAFVGGPKSFNQPVLVNLASDSHLQAFGFITRRDLDNLGISSGKVAVYLPQSYNIAGNLLVVPAEQVEPLDADPGELMAFIVSGGISGQRS